MNQIQRIAIGRSTNFCADALDFLESLPDRSVALFVTSPPYNIGKVYEPEKLSIKDYDLFIAKIVRLMWRKLSPAGSICWQTGNYVKDGEIIPLDILTYKHFEKLKMILRNRIIWRFNFGLHSQLRFSGRYETILWYTKGQDYKFNLDPVRVPQLYPGKRHPATKGERAGKISGNRLGKNPTDYWEFDAESAFRLDPVWDIPNVKANHPEKTDHPAQFPIELAARCILALTDEGELVVDPFGGTGTTVIAAEGYGRVGLGADRDAGYVRLADQRLEQLRSGTLPIRSMGRPTAKPQPNQRVATVPDEWKNGEEAD